MGKSELVIRAFWNPSEQRLRAFWRLGLHTILLLLLTSLFTVGLMLLAALLDLGSGANLGDILAGTSPIAIVDAPWVMLVIVPLATFFGVFSATYLSGRWFDRRPFRKFGMRLSKAWFLDFAFGLGLGAFLMGMVFLVGWLTGSLQVSGFFEVYSQEGGFIAGMLQALVFIVLVGIYEELLSRGYHLINLAEGLNSKWIGKRWALILAFMVSSLAFGLLHLGNPNATWVSAVNITLAGVFLGLGMVLTGSLAIPVGLHITWNFFQGNVFGFAVSGIRTGATVIATQATGPVWLTGGSFGPEAGLLGLGAMLIGSMLIIFWVRRKGKLALAEDLAIFEMRTRRSDHQTQSNTPNLAAD